MFGIMHQRLCGTNSNRFNYCGTCKSIGVSYGHKSRLFLNYDITFLSSLLNEFHEEESYNSAYYEKSCFRNPKHNTIPIVFKYTSALNVYLASIKIQDNIRDSKWLNKLKWFFTGILLANSFKKSKQTLQSLGFPIEKVKALVKENFKNESKNDLALKKYIEPTSKITKIAFEHGARLVNLNDETSSKLGEIGSSLGNAAYCIDATEDLSSDKLKNNFNPIIANDKITINHLKKKTNQHCDIMIDNIANLNISNQFKSRYLLQLATLKSGDKNKKKEKKNKGSIFDGCDCSCCEIFTDCNCSNDGCCNSSDSSCCDNCCECSCDGCCDC